MTVLDVSCAAHGAYVPHSAAMILSVLDGARGHDVRVHFLHGPGLRGRSRDRLRAMTEAEGGTISFVEVPDRRVARLPDAGYFTRAMWYRILLPELLPDVGRVLYLDVDTLVLGELPALWDVDLEDHQVGAVTNVFEPWGERWPADLGLPGPESYFNSGVLLMNLEAMRRVRATELLEAYATEHAERLFWPDQDALNVVLGEDRLALHPRWNTMNNVLTSARAVEIFGEDAVRAAREQPGIRHFEGPSVNKPWHHACRLPHRDRYFDYRRRSPWPRGRLEGLPAWALATRVRQHFTPMRPV